MGDRAASTILPSMLHELAKRHHDGILVRLLWDSGRDAVMVRYRDERTGDRFVTDVPKANALAAFNHPNAFRPAELAAAA
jgi:hypothetical protein